MVIARPIKGRYRKVKTIFSIILLAVFVFLPFIKINSNPAILLDIAGRKFHVFGLTIWPQELFLLNVVLFIAGIILFLATAIGGRLWCAYGCPQSILTDLYDWVGRFIGGASYGKRSMTRIRMTVVRLSWFLLSMVLALVFIRYFVPSEEIFQVFVKANFFIAAGSSQLQTWIYFFFIISIFAFIVWGYFRENVCNFACPYGRFQTAMLDSHSPVIQYDYHRGEPRRQKKISASGDCTSCNMCVAVCPTGIDIRNGMQVGCIHCGLCIDACTHEMERHQKISLIARESFNKFESRYKVSVTEIRKFFFMRPRILLYSTLLIISLSTLGYLLAVRSPVYISLTQDQVLNHIRLPNKATQNGYKLQLANKTNEPMNFQLQVKSVKEKYSEKLRLYGFETEVLNLPAGKLQNNRILVELNIPPEQKLEEKVQIYFVLRNIQTGQEFFSEKIFFNTMKE